MSHYSAFYIDQPGAKLHICADWPTRDRYVWALCTGAVHREWNAGGDHHIEWRRFSGTRHIELISFYERGGELEHIDRPTCLACLKRFRYDVAYLTATLKLLAR